jgi:predicted dehydrogenase
MKNNLKKIIRFITIYGVSRTLNKAYGRIRRKQLKRFYWKNKKRDVSVIGCGQFSFSTICYFIARDEGLVFLSAYDTVPEPAETLSNFYRFKHKVELGEKVLNHPDLKYLFIASNHASHTDYAVRAMRAGVKLVHIEKPISTTYRQLVELLAVQQQCDATLYAGYNRPYSGAVRKLSESVVKGEQSEGFSLNCFVSGHLLADDHWYRQPEEGTRICGNMGHWLDLAVHILAWRKLPDKFKIQIAYADSSTPDDNLIINLSTELGDIISLTLTARSEPFEGINETVNFQYQNVIAKIDDFRKLTVWEGTKLSEYSYFPKDVGHRLAVQQVFRTPDDNRAWEEVVVSTLLMLFITDMVRSCTEHGTFNVAEAQGKLENDLVNHNQSFK